MHLWVKAVQVIKFLFGKPKYQTAAYLDREIKMTMKTIVKLTVEVSKTFSTDPEDMLDQRNCPRQSAIIVEVTLEQITLTL